MRNDKWLINCSCNPHKNTIGHHLRALSEKLDIYSRSCDNFIILGDFNIEVEEQQIKDFCDDYSLKSLIRQPTCYKTNAPKKFESTCVLEIGPTDFHLMAVTIMKKILKKLKPKTINYRYYTSTFQK